MRRRVAKDGRSVFASGEYVVHPERYPNTAGEAMVHKPLISSARPTALQAIMPIVAASMCEWRSNT